MSLKAHRVLYVMPMTAGGFLAICTCSLAQDKTMKGMELWKKCLGWGCLAIFSFCPSSYYLSDLQEFGR